jgi:hypothetical protein
MARSLELLSECGVGWWIAGGRLGLAWRAAAAA